jgi:D-beta-D-heptose 7-phosphate kinase/D-beta-D-heptose 1-phosphate adenosyltransferase
MQRVRKLFQIQNIVVTMGKDGVYVSTPDREELIPADQRMISDVTGAGDVFIAAMTHFIKKGHDLFEACRKANLLAGISVTKFGTYVLTDEDIMQTKVIFTNGCFDILHRGHVEYLRKSRELGARLIVGLNSDASVRRLKGDSRPINKQDDRKRVLESLDCVDEVIIFDEDTPRSLIERVKPDVITKGGDYRPKDVVGNDLASVVIVPLVEGYSTTKIVGAL